MSLQTASSESRHKAPADGKVRTTVTLLPEVHTLGLERAEEERRSFSNYVGRLIELDAARLKAAQSQPQEVGV